MKYFVLNPTIKSASRFCHGHDGSRRTFVNAVAVAVAVVVDVVLVDVVVMMASGKPEQNR